MKSLRNLMTDIYSIPEDQQPAAENVTVEQSFNSKSHTPMLSNGDISAILIARVHSISCAVAHTLIRNTSAVNQATNILRGWIEKKSIVRVIGAGRALLAGSMPGNRLAHAGAQVSFMGGAVPLPNSACGGGIISCSASGKTGATLEAMSIAKKNNPEIRIIGLADHTAANFAELCDVFIGLHSPQDEYPNPLSALADTEEYIISEILDGLVVAAGTLSGFDDQAWRAGHEDIGPTGPYAPKT